MLHKQLPLLIALVIGLASIGFSAVQLYPIYLELSGTGSGGAVLAAAKQSTNKSTPALAQPHTPANRKIADYSMFGDYNASETVKPNTQELPKTNLRLTLTGVSATENQKRATALIEGPDRNTESYGVGDTLPGNADLHSVHNDRVILSRAGKLETLFFAESGSSSRLVSSVTSTRDTSAMSYADVNYQTTGQIPTPRVTIPESVPKMTSDQKQSIRDKLSALRSRLRKQ